MKKRPVVLVILDGWGYAPETIGNAIAQAHPQFFNALLQKYPWTQTKASGEYVGLPRNTPGNSAVGHMTIGCGQIIEKPLTYLNRLCAEKKLCEHPALAQELPKIARSGKTLHLMGLLSDGNVHSSIEHLFGLIACAHKAGIQRIIIHAFLDGRDVPQRSAEKYLAQLEDFLKNYPEAQIGSLHGRFYAMDRDGNWDRTVHTWHVLTEQNSKTRTWQHVLQDAYENNLTDEYIKPQAIAPNVQLHDGDSIIFFNIRADRARQLMTLLLNAPYEKSARTFEDSAQDFYALTKSCKHPHLEHVISGIQYHKNFDNPVLFEWPKIENTLLDRIPATARIMTIAETEKYAHVTYFLNGGREIARDNETRIMIPSKKVMSYAQAPEMSASQITDAVIASLKNHAHDFYVINYANADMVAHTGNIQATIKAIEFLDHELEKLVTIALAQNARILITADHGNAECMQLHNEERNYHTTNPVPTIVISQEQLEDAQLPAQLADIAPFILKHFC